MNVSELKSVLIASPEATLQFILPEGKAIPQHFHVTEVGRVQKDFIDCGGTKRSTITCLLQTWVADDVDHRLTSSKFNRILELAQPILQTEEMLVEVEYEGEFVSQFPILSAETTSSGLVFHLGTKHTDCLAKEKCMIVKPEVSASTSCCSGGGCC